MDEEDSLSQIDWIRGIQLLDILGNRLVVLLISLQELRATQKT